MKLHTQVFLGIVLGIFAGVIFRENAVIFQPIGEVFIRLLRMIIVPIVFASIVVGVMSLGNIQSLGRLGGRTFMFYILTTFGAVCIGLILVNIIQPGVGSQLDVNTVIQAPLELETSGTGINFVEILTDIVPSNFMEAVVQEKMLSIIFVSILFGCALTMVGRTGEVIVKLVEGINDVVLKITDWIMKLAPIGVFSLMAALVGRTGITAFRPLLFYIVTVMVALIVHVLIVQSGVLMLIGKYSPITFFKRFFPAIATAFSTNSSVATLPVSMECLEKKVGVSKKVVGFVAPLGATMNMDGTALYEVVAALFIAQVYGVHLSFTQQLIVGLTAVLASVGTAGIPSAGLVTMIVVLRSVDLPLESIGLLLAVDRIIDMCRTTVNVLGDGVAAIVISRLEGDKLTEPQ